MLLRQSAFLTDENIHPEVLAYMRSAGLDAVSVQQHGLGGSPDTAILRVAHAEQRVVLTHDSDFGTLAVASGEPFFGIVYLRPGHIRPEFTIGTLQAVLTRELPVSPPFIIVAHRADHTIRIRARQM